MRLKQYLVHNLLQIPGWHTNRKIVVIESDDWGSIRMPSINVYKRLLKRGIRVDKHPYSRYDSLASETDLAYLFEVLSSIKDKNSNHPIITANSILTNPDFEKIRFSGFQEYHYEVFTKTLSQYPEHKKSFELWKEGIQSRVFHPQFHGREHLNVNRWMEALRENRGNVRLAFEYRMFSLSEGEDISDNSFVDALSFKSNEELEFLKKSIEEGTEMFSEIFGYKSKTFIAPRYSWHNSLNKTLSNCGIRGLQGIWYQYEPMAGDSHRFTKRFHFTGQKNKLGQSYLVRNSSFEPSLNRNYDWVSDVLKRMSIAFRWGKPVILGIHRLNFIGFIERGNRDHNLTLFKELLYLINKNWPEIEFLTSDQLLDLMQTKLDN